MTLSPSPAPVALRRSDPLVKKLLAATFPTYKGRKITLVPFDRPLHLDLSWSGGTVDKVVLVDLANGRIGKLVVPAPWSIGAADPVDCPPNALLVVHSYFCGVDAGITVYARPASVPALGPGHLAVSA